MCLLCKSISAKLGQKCLNFGDYPLASIVIGQAQVTGEFCVLCAKILISWHKCRDRKYVLSKISGVTNHRLNMPWLSEMKSGLNYILILCR